MAVGNECEAGQGTWSLEMLGAPRVDGEPEERRGWISDIVPNIDSLDEGNGDDVEIKLASQATDVGWGSG